MPSPTAEIIGISQRNGNRFAGINTENVIFMPVNVPDNGWLESINLWAGGWNTTTFARLCVWDRNGQLMFAGPQQTWEPGLAFRTQEVPAGVVRTPKAQIFYIGFWRHPEFPAQWGTYWPGAGTFHHYAQTHLQPLHPPLQSQQSIRHSDEALTAYSHWLRNTGPLKPAWRDPTPAGPTPFVSPQFTATLPHAGVEGALAVLSGDILLRPTDQPEPSADEPYVRSFDVAFADPNDVIASLGPSEVFIGIREREDIKQFLALETAKQSGSGDAIHDYSVRVEIERYGVHDGIRGGRVNLVSWEVKEEENQQGYFNPIRLFTREEDRTYDVRVRHQDSWGIWSQWSNWTRYTNDEGPFPPDQLTPLGRLPGVAGWNYSFRYTHADERAGNRFQIRIFNETGAVQLFPVYGEDRSLIHNSVYTVSPNFHEQLTPGRKYRWAVRTRDNQPMWGPWSQKKLFYPNATPYIPTNLSPSGGQALSPVLLFASIADPDNDPILETTARILRAADNLPVYNSPPFESSKFYSLGETVRPSTPNGHRYRVVTPGTTGVQQPTWPTGSGAQVTSGGVVFAEDGSDIDFDMEISADGRSASLDVTEFLNINTEYKWQSRSYDGILWSEFSAFSAFRYAQAPTVSLLAPSEAGLLNLAVQPSAEYDPTVVGNAWTVVGADAQNTIIRVTDEDAPSGIAAWEAATTGKPDFVARHNPIFINSERYYFFALQLKNYTGTPDTYLRLACYGSSDNFLGWLGPDSLGALSGEPATDFWTRYGGLVSPATSTDPHRFPVGTSYVRPEVWPSATAATPGLLRFDQLFYSEVNTNQTPELFERVQGFYGYFDGDTPTYGNPVERDRFWEGVAGNSISRGPAVLDTPSAYVEFEYHSDSGSPKADDKVIVEWWDGSEWTDVFTSPYADNGARTLISLPTQAVGNEGRYRVFVYAKDSAGLEGRSAPAYFDVIYQGPSELVIEQAAPDAENGQIVVDFQPSELDPLEFGGIEVLVTDRTGTEVVYYIRDPEADRFIYHFPENGVTHNIRLRQIQLIGEEQIEGRWSTVQATVDYFPRFFLKSVENPEVMSVGFYAHEKPTYAPTRHVKEYLTWGRKQPAHGVGKPRYDKGAITAFLYDHFDFPQTADERFRMMEQMEEEMGHLCLLSHKPGKKRFIQLTGLTHSISESEDLIVALTYSETAYSESAVERGEVL